MQAGSRQKLTYPPMEDGELRKFTFDPYYTDCKLKDRPKFYVTKFVIEKGSTYSGLHIAHIPLVMLEETYAIYAALNKDSVTERNPDTMLESNWISRASCIQGEVVAVKTAEDFRTGVHIPADQCGLATLLSYLCMVDDDVSAGLGYAFSKIMRKPKFAGITKKLPSIEATCEKVIHYNNAAEPYIGARAYLNAAMDSNFLLLYTYIPISDDSIPTISPISPSEGKVETIPILRALEEYTTEATAWEFVKRNGDEWYFCKEKK